MLVRVLTQQSIWSDQWNKWLNESQELVAPSLIYYEVSNTLYQYQKNNLYSAQFTTELMHYALDYPIKLANDMLIHKRALKIASKFTLSATYDAHYVAVAESYTCPLWTADAKLAKKYESQKDVEIILLQ